MKVARSLTPIIAALLLSASSISAFAVESFQLPNVPYGTPPAHVSRWIRIAWLGDLNHPIVPVYFITTKRAPPKFSLTTYVMLEEKEYVALANFSRSIRCSTEHISEKPPYPLTIGVDELQDRKTHEVCVLARADGCPYLFGLSKLPDIDWSRRDTLPLYRFEAELGCPEPLTPAPREDVRHY
jgi:hypothetical protein